jgi:CubicO group peptidase (beta-lactamase class C family)
MSTAGLSKARLDRMHDVMAGHIERRDLPGLVTLVSRRGEVHVDAIGMMALGGNDPMRRDTIFRIASMTKPITAAATMILVEDCKLRLDEAVDGLLPELANRRVLKRIDAPLDDTVPANRPITVRDLLTFRMGFGSVMAPPGTYPIQKAMSDLQIGGDGPPNPSKSHARRVDPPPRNAAAHASARRALAVQHGLRRVGCPGRARLGPAVRDVFARTNLRSARHEGHRFQRAGGKDRAVAWLLSPQSRNQRARSL